MKILIAEDDPLMVKLYEIIFREDDISVCINGEDFIMAYSDDYDIFIVDLKMPVKDGWEVLKFLRGIDNKVPVAVCTAYSASSVLGTLHDELIIQKPIVTKNLRDRLIKYIGQCAN